MLLWLRNLGFAGGLLGKRLVKAGLSILVDDSLTIQIDGAKRVVGSPAALRISVGEVITIVC